ncbi:MAG: hypothetical protein IPL40_01330 [Proteobacteria bacterium]|nr:hypothetical protein [Pseudomonadota bacterium]
MAGPALRRSLLGRRCREEQGQALPLAALGALVLALGLMSTVNLTQAVHEKIKLQNAADSAAYTLAAQEARTFNYIAFLNRAQIAHYNTAMMVQSYITWVGFQIGVFAMGTDTLSTLHLIGSAVLKGLRACCSANHHKCCVQAAALSPPLAGLGQVVAALRWMLGQLRNQIYPKAETMAHAMVAAIHLFNRDVVWRTQLSRALLMNLNLLGGAQGYVEKNDPDLAAGGSRRAFLNTVVNGALNSLEYYQAFDRGSGVNPSFVTFLGDLGRVASGGAYSVAGVTRHRGETHASAPEVQAYRVMAELCNATRWPMFVSNRGVAHWSVGFGSFMPSYRGGKRGQTAFIQDAAITHGGLRELHQPTTSYALDGSNVADFGPPEPGKSRNYSLGTVLGSDDYVDSGRLSALIPGVPVLGLALSKVLGAGGDSLGDAIAAYDDPEGLHKRYESSSVLAIATLLVGVADAFGPGFSFDSLVKGGMAKLDGMLDQVKAFVATGKLDKHITEQLVGAAKGALGAVSPAAKEVLGAVESGDVVAYAKNKVVGQAGALVKQAGDWATRLGGGLIGGRMGDTGAELPDGFGELGRILGEIGFPVDDLPHDPVSGDLGVHGAGGPSCSGPECHAWWPGFAPYFAFNASSDRTRDFNQPSTWIFLTKYHQDFGRAGRARTSDALPVEFSWRQAGRQATVDLSPGGYASSYPFEGFNVVARGMAYYHRPGSWTEQPNFFNPFWRARLAPVAQKLQALWEGYVGSNLSSTADNMVVRGLLNVVRNAQMDLFTAAITTLATH